MPRPGTADPLVQGSRNVIAESDTVDDKVMKAADGWLRYWDNGGPRPEWSAHLQAGRYQKGCPCGNVVIMGNIGN